MSYPPGFRLTEVEELVAVSDFSLLFGAGSTEILDVGPAGKGMRIIREIDEKFVSFDAIQQVEWGKHVETATEPYREKAESE